MRAAITILLGTSLLFAAPREVKSSVSREWIATYTGKSNPPWKKLAGLFRSRLQWRDSFGPEKRFGIFKSFNDETPPDILGVTWQRNFIYSSFETPDPDFAKSWGLDNTGNNPGPDSHASEGTKGADIGAVKAWAIAAPPSATATLAILDTGLNTSHEEFAKRGFSVSGWNTVDDTSNILDDNGHGTSVAGVIAAGANNGKGSRGVYSGPILVVKMLDKNANGTTESAIRAIQFAVEKGVKVINASWGGIIFDQALYDVVKWAGSHGVLLVAAAGNSGNNNDTDPLPTYPAAFRLSNILSVAAYDRQDSLATFSNFGPETVDLGAPGVDIFSPRLSGYDFVEGTSFAAPFASAAAAMAREKFPSLSPNQLREKILQSTTPLHYYEKHHTRSGGRLNLYNLLAGIEPERPKTPTQWVQYKKPLASEHPYLPNTKETLVITHPGAKYMRVHFTRFELENKYDMVRIKDKGNRLVTTYSGVLGDFISDDVLEDTIKIEFLSDFGAQQWGFEIDSYEVAY